MQKCCSETHAVCQVTAAAAAQVAAARQASVEAKARAAAEAERRVEESKAELAQVKEQLAAVLDYKQRKEVLEEEVAKLNAELAKLKTDTAQQVQFLPCVSLTGSFTLSPQMAIPSVTDCFKLQHGCIGLLASYLQNGRGICVPSFQPDVLSVSSQYLQQINFSKMHLLLLHLLLGLPGMGMQQ